MNSLRKSASGKGINIALEILSPVRDTRNAHVSPSTRWSIHITLHSASSQTATMLQLPLNFPKFPKGLPLLMETLITPRERVSLRSIFFRRRNFVASRCLTSRSRYALTLHRGKLRKGYISVSKRGRSTMLISSTAANSEKRLRLCLPESLGR